MMRCYFVGMCKKRWVLALAVGMGIGSAAAQDAEQALRNALVNNQMYLRGYSADPVVRWRWNGKELVNEAPHLRTVGVFVAASVDISGEQVEIGGLRRTLLRDGDTHFDFSVAREPVT